MTLRRLCYSSPTSQLPLESKTHKLGPKPDRCCEFVSTIMGMNKPSETRHCSQLAVHQEQVVTALRRDAYYDSLVSYLRS